MGNHFKFLSIEPADNANAEGVIECIKSAFERIGILDFQKRIMGLNVEGASVNTGVEKSVPKPSKSYGTRWIDHKLTSMKIMLENYGAYISHVESLSQTDSQALKRAELKGYLLKLKDASIPISLTIYLDVLSPLKRLSLSFQHELRDPVKAVRHIQDFNLTMVKLKLLADESLENPDNIMTNLKKLFQDKSIFSNTYSNTYFL